MKIIAALAFAAILASLLLAGVFMLRDSRAGRRKSGLMLRALATRVALSVLLFAFVIVSFLAGWVHPTGLPLGQ